MAGSPRGEARAGLSAALGWERGAGDLEVSAGPRAVVPRPSQCQGGHEEGAVGSQMFLAALLVPSASGGVWAPRPAAEGGGREQSLQREAS